MNILTKNGTNSLKTTLRALSHRNYRMFFLGQGLSLTGTWMQSVAVSWLVFRLTQSSVALGIVGFSGQIPIFLLSPFAGVLSDRLNRRKILITVQALAMVQALALAAVTISGSVQIWQIVALSLFLGIVNGFDMPTRQAFVIEMLEDKNDLGNAIALNSALFNASRLIGPSVAGVLIGFAGEGLCFLINALSYTAALSALLAMKIPAKRNEKARTRIFNEMKEGIRYAYNFSPIRDLLIFISAMSLIGMSFPVLLPIFAKQVLHGDSHAFGFLVSASGAGAIAGTIFLASRPSAAGLDKIIRLSIFIFGAGLIGFSLSGELFLSLTLLVVIGFGLIVSVASSNTILQTIVEEDKRGRVMSFYTMSFMGAAPVGSLLAGVLSSKIGAPPTVMIGGFLTIIGGIIFAWRLPFLRKAIRPVFRKMGIIPEMAIGIQTAAELGEKPGPSVS